jgi:hypothetical protein
MWFFFKFDLLKAFNYISITFLICDFIKFKNKVLKFYLYSFFTLFCIINLIKDLQVQNFYHISIYIKNTKMELLCINLVNLICIVIGFSKNPKP